MLLAAMASSRPAAAQDSADRVAVVEMSGLIDPVVVDFVTDQLRRADRERAAVVVLVVDSGGVAVSADDYARFLTRLEQSPVPVTAWVGPSGATARNGAEQVVARVALAGISARSTVDDPEGGRRHRGQDAVDAGLVDVFAPVVGDFIVALDGRELGGRTLSIAEVVGEGEERRRQPRNVSFAKPALPAQVMHAVASPAIAYLLLSAALVLLVLELYTGGVGVAGGVGALALVLAAYGLAVLDAQPVGVALIAVGVLGFAVDVQTGVPRLWTAIGTVAYVAGSLLLFDGPGISLGWLPLVAGVAGMVLMMLAGVPSVVRSRFSTPTIGRQSMIGEMGEAVAAVSPDGVVRVRDALWRARTNRATPIAEGARVRVTGIDGVLLEVEPEEGGARDYRR